MASEQVGDGGGREFQRIVDALRNRLTSGTYRLGEQLPSQRAIADEFRVSRDTVQRVLRELVSEGWIETRQGSGTRVIKAQQVHSPDGTRTGHGRGILGRFIAAAFESPTREVTLDVFTLTSESLDTHVRLQAERVRAGEIAPTRIAVRMLLPAENALLAYPRNTENYEDRRPIERLHDITRRHSDSLSDALMNLRTEGLVDEVEVQVRHLQLTPAFKLYLLNSAEALHGFYEVVERRIRLADGEEIDAIDALGLNATLFHYAKDADPGTQGSLFVDAGQRWFDSQWELLAR
ncbi:winged helix-turn-helix domain-containing protein [Streptomyces sp. NBC_01465]|uniref:winged helix-turn-helix domain-containing protein n=1 Tax=Streptomyces sp. NBC_01465 TaxID=2903878 RepID=UPI002E30E0B3|nr:winged helix-turn-helix domain-containing protein [Streptomyces sp. NBC_01465]